MIDTEAIRAAFAIIADEAPQPEGIYASLAMRARQHRQRRIVLRAVGAGVAAATVGATGVGVWRLVQQPDAGFPTISGGPGGGWLEVPLRYHPTWLPSGYGQSSRSVLVADDQATVVSLDWQPGGAAPDGRTPTVSLTIGWHEVLEPNRPMGRTENVDINGVAGQVIQTEGEQSSPYVIWQPPGQPQLIVSLASTDDLDEQRTTALRIARSVRPDQRHTWVGPRFGWMPTDLATVPWHHVLSHDGVSWVQSISATAPGGRQLDVSIGPDLHIDQPEPRTVAQPIQVRRFVGWQAPERGQLFLSLSDGVQVFLQMNTGWPDSAPTPNPDQTPAQPPNPIPELIRIVEEFDFGPWPDMTWVGTR